jgi:hypothetical protein
LVSIVHAESQGAGRSWIEVDPRLTGTAAKNEGVRPPTAVSPKRYSNASEVCIAAPQMNMSQGILFGPQLPFTP